MVDRILINLLTVCMFAVFFAIFYTEYLMKLFMFGRGEISLFVKWGVYFVIALLFGFIVFATITYYKMY